jgi:hypothetical protein
VESSLPSFHFPDLAPYLLLYDEVKMLSPSLCLGIGGINAARGRGDHFFFALVP